jgi:hypothetical protein
VVCLQLLEMSHVGSAFLRAQSYALRVVAGRLKLERGARKTSNHLPPNHRSDIVIAPVPTMATYSKTMARPAESCPKLAEQELAALLAMFALATHRTSSALEAGRRGRKAGHERSRARLRRPTIAAVASNAPEPAPAGATHCLLEHNPTLPPAADHSTAFALPRRLPLCTVARASLRSGAGM